MSVLRPGDEQYHHQDGSHRWAGGDPDIPLEAWQAAIRAHMQEHLITMGGPIERGRGAAVCALPSRVEKLAARAAAERQRRAS